MKPQVACAALAAALALPLSAHAADDQDLSAIRAEIAKMKQDYEARLAALEQRLQDTQAALAQARNAASPAAAAPSAPLAPPLADAATASSAQAAAATSAAAAQLAPPLAAAFPGAPAVAPAGPSAQLAPPLAETAPAASPAAAAPAGAGAANVFNPAISLVLGGTYASLQRDPSTWRLGGFLPPGGEVGPGSRSFSLGESELTLAASIDPLFSGQLTFSLSPENEVSVEEAFIRTRAYGNGLNLQAGRFLSGIGYLNGQHRHAWDFVDAPLAYQAFLGGQYKPDGLRATWLAPTDMFVELGAEVGNGSSFPGTDRNKNGANATALYAHLGDDVGTSGSWRAGLSYLRTRADNREFDEDGMTGAFSGRSRVWIADAIYKWAPNGNSTQTNLKLQGEYFRRTEDGRLGLGEEQGAYGSRQSGWYVQGVYQFMPAWRVGLRYDRLDSGSVSLGGLDPALFPALASYHPIRSTVMLDWSPSEFSRLRLQFAQDKARRGESDHQIYLQYVMSLGTHAAHAF